MKVIKTSWLDWKDGFKCGRCNTVSPVTHKDVFFIRQKDAQGKDVTIPAFQCPKCDTINKLPYPGIPHAVRISIPAFKTWKERQIEDEQRKKT